MLNRSENLIYHDTVYYIMNIRQFIAHPITRISCALGAEEKVKIILDNCPPGFDFTEAGTISVEKIEVSTEVMKKINSESTRSKP